MTANAICNGSIVRLVKTTLFVIGIRTVVFVKMTNSFIREGELCLDERTVETGLEFNRHGLGTNFCNESMNDAREILYRPFEWAGGVASYQFRSDHAFQKKRSEDTYKTKLANSHRTTISTSIH